MIIVVYVIAQKGKAMLSLFVASVFELYGAAAGMDDGEQQTKTSRDNRELGCFVVNVKQLENEVTMEMERLTRAHSTS